MIGGYKPTKFADRCLSKLKLGKQACNEVIFKPASGPNQKPCKQACNEVVIYNPVSNEWKKSVSMKEARAEFGCARWGSSVYVVGGFDKYHFSSTTVEYRNLDNDDTWTIVSKSELLGFVSDQFLLAGIFCSIEKKMYTFFDGKIYSITIDLQERSSYVISEEENILFSDNGLLMPFSNRYVANSF